MYWIYIIIFCFEKIVCILLFLINLAIDDGCNRNKKNKISYCTILLHRGIYFENYVSTQSHQKFILIIKRLYYFQRPSILSSAGTSRIERPPSVARGRAEGGRGESSGEDQRDGSPDTLYRQNLELRHRLEEEASNYKRRLDTYRQAQQHQAALVSRLQAKVSSISHFSIFQEE